MAALAFHPAAAQNFNQIAADLRASLTEFPRSSLSSGRPQFEPEVVPAHHLGPDDIEGLTHRKDVDPHSFETLGIVYDDGARAHQLAGESIATFRRLIAAVWRNKEISQRVSADRIEDELIDWLNPAREGDVLFTDYFVAHVSPEILKQTVWVPIANLSIQSPIPFGRVAFVPITGAVIDAWEKTVRERSSFSSEEADRYFHHIRTTFQGLAAVVISVVAEQGRAAEVATDEAQRATALLRTYCPENFHPLACSDTVPFGRSTWSYPASVDGLAFGSQPTFHGRLGPEGCLGHVA